MTQEDKPTEEVEVAEDQVTEEVAQETEAPDDAVSVEVKGFLVTVDGAKVNLAQRNINWLEMKTAVTMLMNHVDQQIQAANSLGT